MDVRKKLVELLQDENNPVWGWFPNNMAMMQLADYLISNGVTVQERSYQSITEEKPSKHGAAVPERSTRMRLIDADALMDVIRQHEYHLATTQGSIDYGMFTFGIQQAVDEQPTIDAVPVVRCRDCKHLNVVNRKELYAHCPKTNTVFLSFELDTREHFCSLGERKEGVE